MQSRVVPFERAASVAGGVGAWGIAEKAGQDGLPGGTLLAGSSLQE